MRVLVVDDSATHRLLLASALRDRPETREVETAASGEEALRRLVATTFDLVCLDIEMPGMDGFAVLRWIMARRPIPVLVVSDRRHDRTALTALELGAFEVLGKPSPRAGSLVEWKKQLADIVREVSSIRVDVLAGRARAAEEAQTRTGRIRRIKAAGAEATAAGATPAAARAVELPPPAGRPALVVASSTGGPPALRDLFAALPPRPVIAAVAQHMPSPFTRSLAARLARVTGWDAREAQGGEEAVPGILWIAPGGRHLRFVRADDRIVTHISADDEGAPWCPSADFLFESAAALWGRQVVAVVLTGMGDDGAAGARAVARAGGTVLCESRDTAVIPGMPDAAARAVPSARRLRVEDMGSGLHFLL